MVKWKLGEGQRVFWAWHWWMRNLWVLDLVSFYLLFCAPQAKKLEGWGMWGDTMYQYEQLCSSSGWMSCNHINSCLIIFCLKLCLHKTVFMWSTAHCPAMMLRGKIFHIVRHNMGKCYNNTDSFSFTQLLFPLSLSQWKNMHCHFLSPLKVLIRIWELYFGKVK